MDVTTHNPDAEEAVLGAMFITHEAVRAVLELGLKPGDFYNETHRRLYAVLIECFESGRTCDYSDSEEQLVETARHLSKGRA